MKMIWIAAAACLAPGAAGAELQGPPEAVALADKMIDRLGGVDAWAKARTLTLVYRGWNKDPAREQVETAIRDLQQPWSDIYYYRGGGVAPAVEYHQRPDRSWLVRDGETIPFDDEQNAANQTFWLYDFYTVLHRFAAGDDDVKVALDDGRLALTGPEGEDWGWFEIDATGQPVRWGANYQDEPLEYIYGPVIDFGEIAFPAWGAATDGSWRFAYEHVGLTIAPPEEVEEPQWKD